MSLAITYPWQSSVLGPIDPHCLEEKKKWHFSKKGFKNCAPKILKQNQNDPFTVEDQIAIIYAGSKNLLRDVPVERVKEFERDYIEVLNAKHRGTLDTLKAGKLTDEVTDTLTQVAADLSKQYAG